MKVTRASPHSRRCGLLRLPAEFSLLSTLETQKHAPAVTRAKVVIILLFALAGGGSSAHRRSRMTIERPAAGVMRRRLAMLCLSLFV